MNKAALFMETKNIYYGKSIADIYTEATMAMFAQDEDLRFLGSA